MYDVDALRRRVGKQGIEVTISDLKSSIFNPFQMKQLEASMIFVNGVPNVPFIRSLFIADTSSGYN